MTGLKCTSVVVKIASRCNINCTYCYMYNKGDTTFKAQPKMMCDEVRDALFEKVKMHCLINELDRFLFILHGGEPMLTGKEYIKNFVAKAREVLEPEVVPRFSLQTNGILIDEEWCDLFVDQKISVGISLDGSKEINDRFRLDHKGNGTYDRVMRGLKITQNAPSWQKTGKSAGILSVMNVDSDPLEAYEHLKEIGVKSVNFILPDNTYDDPPTGLEDIVRGEDLGKTPYADWLITIFDQWFEEKDDRVKVSFFNYIIYMVLGVELSFDYLGSSNMEIMVVETDGSLEAVDALKICGNGFTKNNANVRTHTFEDALQTELADLYHHSKQKLCKYCSACPIQDICGGGFIPHRYSKENGFDNPSLYCNDLLKLITHIQSRVMSEFPAKTLAELGIEPLGYEEAKSIIQETLKVVEDPRHASLLRSYSHGDAA